MYAHGAQIKEKEMQNLEVEFLAKVLKTFAGIDDAENVVEEIRNRLETGKRVSALRVLVDASRVIKAVDLPFLNNKLMNEAVSVIKEEYISRGYRETAFGFEYQSPPKIALNDAKDFVELCKQVFKL